MSFNNIYHKKRVLITGHAGFKGCWLSMWLKKLGAEVYGYSLKPDTTESFYDIIKLPELLYDSKIADIRNRQELFDYVAKVKPDIIFHLAAQPLVRLSYFEPITTYETNVIGTLNVLEAARLCPSVKAFVNVTTDKCYENKEKNQGYTEDEPMGGYDMYSSSKGCSEILSASYRRSFLENGKPFALATGRAGNVIGGGDWAKDRLIVDCINSIIAQKTIYIRNPLATRPWQFVLEPLAGYLRLGQKLLENGAQYAQGYNFGPHHNSVVKVAEVAKMVTSFWGEGRVEVGGADGLHEATLLELNIEKAKQELGIEPVYDVKQAVAATTAWYKEHYLQSADMREFSYTQIAAFEQAAQSKQILWSLA
ncbi:MAG: CDP-glucose 4,6-dehydratase [Alphaproteobacteria bacterium]|nr:CDP-glucose 4,6-dehydratase [Alphaproteobacteria bacterium]